MFNISSNFTNISKFGFTGSAPAKNVSNDEQEPQKKKTHGHPEKDEFVKSDKHKDLTNKHANSTEKSRKTKKRERKELKKKAEENALPPLTPEKIKEIQESKNVPDEVKAEILALPLNDTDAYNKGMKEIIEKHEKEI